MLARNCPVVLVKDTLARAQGETALLGNGTAAGVFGSIRRELIRENLEDTVGSVLFGNYSQNPSARLALHMQTIGNEL